MEKQLTEEERAEAGLRILKVFDTISGMFELGCDIKIDNEERVISITGYDELDRDEEQYDGGSQSHRVRFYQAQVWIEDNDEIGSDIIEVMDTIEKDTERMAVCRKKLLP